MKVSRKREEVRKKRIEIARESERERKEGVRESESMRALGFQSEFDSG